MSRLNHIETLNITDQEERIYIDVKTQDINLPTNPSVTGQANKFTLDVGGLSLDQSKNWTVEIISFSYYSPSDSAGNEQQPIILCDLSDPIMVNGFTSSVLFKSQYISGFTPAGFYTSDLTNNINFVRNVKYRNINSIQFEIVNAKNGKPFIFGGGAGQDIVTIILLIKNKL